MKHDRIYLNESDNRVFIDTYIANDPSVRDAMLVIPGGGYTTVCTNREGEPVALDFFAKGYNAFVLNYRCGKAGDVYPCQLLDAAAAMIYIREHAEEFSINPERVFAVGFSAGGHLCGSLATMFAYPEMMDAYGDKYKMIRPTASILSYPVIRARDNTHRGTFEHLLGKSIEEYTEEEITRFSIDTAVSAESAPMFIWHTAEDTLVPVEGSLYLGIALSRNGVPFRLSVYPYGPHGISLGTKQSDFSNPAMIQPLASCWTAQADEWMKTVKNYKF